jgi:hypothetical protein
VETTIGRFPFFFQPTGHFPGRGRLSAALQTDQQEYGWELARIDQFGGVPPQQAHQFVPHDADDFLGRCQPLLHHLAQRTDTNSSDQLFDNLEVNVGLEQSKTNFPQGFIE